MPYLMIDRAASPRITLVATLVALIVGGAILIPALAYLYTLFQREHAEHAGSAPPG
jgi:cytochrome bd ubiquinol oxidase subunit II